jgi:hypothetical protein
MMFENDPYPETNDQDGLKLILLVVITATFWTMVFTRPLFFGGDDWYVFYHLGTKESWQLLTYLFTTHMKHLFPFTLTLLLIELKLFGLSYLPFQIVGIIIHLFVTVLLYRFLTIHIPNRWTAFYSTLFFSISGAYWPQAVGWSIGQGIMCAFAFLLCALLAVDRYMKGRRVMGPVVIVACILSALSFGSGLITPMVILFYYLLFRPRKGGPSFNDKKTDPLPYILGALQAALVVISLYMIRLEMGTTGVPSLLQPRSLIEIVEFVCMGIASLIFACLGGRILLLYNVIGPGGTFAFNNITFDTALPVGALLLLVLSTATCAVIMLWKNRPQTAALIGKNKRPIIFALGFMILIYAIKAAGRIEGHDVIDFMKANNYRYEPFLGLTLILGILGNYIAGLVGRGNSAGFRRSIMVLMVLIFATLSAPIVVNKGHEFVADSDFVTAYRKLITGHMGDTPYVLCDLPYTFHDRIGSSFFLSCIARMDNMRPKNITFIPFRWQFTVTDKEAVTFYYIYFPHAASISAGIPR